jgi:hypothetical protein
VTLVADWVVREVLERLGLAEAVEFEVYRDVLRIVARTVDLI